MYARIIALPAVIGIVALAACGGSSGDGSSGGVTPPPVNNTVNFTGAMNPSNEVSVKGNPTGSGTFTASLDTVTNLFKWDAEFNGLTTNATMGHIHGPFTPGTSGSAGVILNFDPAVTTGATFTGLNTATSGSAKGTVTLNAQLSLTPTINGDSLKKLLLAGLVYVNIHTVTNGGGEIRSQITKGP